MEKFVSEMNVNNLNVDLLQDTASISLYKHEMEQGTGKNYHTSITINVPIATPGNQPENRLKQVAIEAAKKALHEALQALERHRF
ncbi:hypothetical protein [Methylorubrum extorquens]|uniref:hypothetical protein n=1 Tax=Methylorubrum extorquens TaxID=408 RepID=UPI002238B9FC|nr:hypothetical protein [Methylorubrum extorquens]UYW33616.1 hypothetical protein OKB92_05920 [Methylorubrum extorquens]